MTIGSSSRSREARSANPRSLRAPETLANSYVSGQLRSNIGRNTACRLFVNAFYDFRQRADKR